MSVLMEISSREGEMIQETGRTAGARSTSGPKQMGPGEPAAERSTHRTGGGPGNGAGHRYSNTRCGWRLILLVRRYYHPLWK